MKKKMSIVLAGMLLCFAPDMFANETDGKIKGIVMDGELGGPLEFVTVQVKAKGSDKIVQGSVTGLLFLISAMKKYLKIFLSAAITRF